MKKQKGNIMCSAVCILILGLAVSSFISCSPQRRTPGNRMEDDVTKEEPTISLYIAETQEKKNIKMEEYIKGVVAAEMEPDWPMEALAAQAILARTFTLERMKSIGKVPKRGTDASTNIEEFQAYNPKRINENVVKAVERTRGEVVKYQGKHIKAWFHADGGGRTAASAEEGLAYTKEPSPYIQSVKDPGYQITLAENKNWQAQFPISTVRQKVKEVTGKDPGNIEQVKITKKGPSGRAMVFRIGSIDVSGPALRLALGKEKMRSTLVTDISLTDGKLVIMGKGFGHGVGMSQWGAKALAEKGTSPEDIIKYFFKNVEISKDWK